MTKSNLYLVKLDHRARPLKTWLRLIPKMNASKDFGGATGFSELAELAPEFKSRLRPPRPRPLNRG